MSSPPSKPRRRPGAGAFTLIELLVVITIIVILVGLTVGVAGFAQTKAARSRAEGEIKALSAAAENYKSDNGAYPRSTNTDGDKVDARQQGDPGTYRAASRDLYALLTGQTNDDGTPKASPAYPPRPAGGAKVYFDFKPNMLGGKDGSGAFPAGVTSINDPWGNSYGYSTVFQADLDKNQNPPKRGYNPTFDLWSTCNKSVATSTGTGGQDATSALQPVWVTNW